MAGREEAVSYSVCFICGQENYSGNETRITVERKNVDKETFTRSSLIWAGYVCDDCLRDRFGILRDEVCK